MSVLTVVNLGTIEYGEALALQEKLWTLRIENKIGDTILLLEHPSVLTLGRRGNRDNILIDDEELKKNGVEIHDITRGGDVTYHGPGQIVGYPIMLLDSKERDIKTFVSSLQDAIINLLHHEYNIEGHKDDKKYTGVWVGDNKIAAIGIAVKKAVTMHGFAFNINTDLSHFGWINPCGITDKGVTSLQQLTGKPQDMQRLYTLTANYLGKAFGQEINMKNKEELMNL